MILPKSINAFFKILSLFLLAAITLAALPSCRKKPEYRVMVSQCSGGEWRDRLNDEMRREAAFTDSCRINLQIIEAHDSIEVQRRQLHEMAAQHPDAIVIAPAEADTLRRDIERIWRSGIPVVVFDREVEGHPYNVFVGADNEGIGAKAAQYARLHIRGPVTAVQLMGNLLTTPAEARGKGFAKGAQSTEGFCLLASEDCGWHPYVATAKADSLLALYPDINLIFCHNDDMAIAVSERLHERGVRDRVMLIGVDGSPGVGIRAVQDSTLDATVIYPTLGHEIMQTAIALARGEEVPSEVHPDEIVMVDAASAPLYMLQLKSIQAETSTVDGARQALHKMTEQRAWERWIAALAALAVLAVIVAGVWWSHRAITLRHRRESTVYRERHDALSRAAARAEEKARAVEAEAKAKTAEAEAKTAAAQAKTAEAEAKAAEAEAKALAAGAIEPDGAVSEFLVAFKKEVFASLADEDLSVEQIGERMGVGRVQLYRKLKSMTSKSPSQLLREWRLEEGKRLLSCTDLTVAETAAKVGFASASYFTRCYREHFGELPRARKRDRRFSL